jgi:hypothetical protein
LDCTTSKHAVIKFIFALFVGFSYRIASAQVPVVNSIVPASGIQGSTLNLTVTGSGFTPTSTLLFSSDGILVKSVRVISATSIQATVVLNTSAGKYTFWVPGSNASSMSSISSGFFSVVPSILSVAAELQVNDFAGSADNSGSSDGPARDARFFAPFGASIDSGNLYLADYVNSTVRKISLAAASVTTLAGKAGTFDAIDGAAAVARFGEPVGIWAQNDAVFVSDAYYNTIRSISADGNVTTIAGSASAPSGFSDGVGSLAQFRSPAGIWGDGTNLYVCDSLNFTIRKIVIATGQVTTLAGLARVQGQNDGVSTAAQFQAPTEVWGNGVRLYIGDGNAIRQVTIATGEVQTVAGNAGIAGYADGAGLDARFSFISGIWGDGANLFIADSGNHVIRKLNLQTAYVTTVAGLATVPGTDDGTGIVAQFDNPSGIAGDGTSLYVIDSLNFTVRQATAPASTQPDGSTLFVLGGDSGFSHFTSGIAPSVQVGYGTLHGVSGSIASGMAIIDFRDSGTLVSEAAFPPSSMIGSGRLSVEMSASVNTGLAIANPNSDSVTLKFYFTDGLGAQLYASQTLIPANSQFMAFLNQPPFSPPPQSPQSVIGLRSARTFTYTASKPIAVAALRSLTNERGEFLMSALPVVSLNSTNSSPVMLPVYADGGGWSSQVVVINPTDSTITGSLQFFTQGSGSSSGTLAPLHVNGILGSGLNYGIPPRSSVRFLTSGEGANVQVGSVRLVPAAGSANPSAFLVVSYRSQDITLLETIVPGISPNSSFSLYAERSGDFAGGGTDSIHTAIAVTNPSANPGQVNFELTNLDGTPTGLATSITVPGNGQIQTFLTELPGFANLANPFKGILRITGNATSVLGLRARYNARHDFLVTTTPPTIDSSPSSGDIVFPLLVNGQGYATQLVLFGGSGGQGSTVTLKISNPSGQPIGMGLLH